MSSWNKASKTNQKLHRERHQPEHRAHLGLLEKKKDYKLRSSDFHAKQDTIKLLKRRAEDRNPDEFYFHMINSRVEDGEHKEIEKEDEHTPDQIRLMQTQDLKYITYKRTIEGKKIDRLQSQLHLIDAANSTPNKHIFFVDSTKEAKSLDVATRLDTHPDLVARRTNRLRKADLKKMSLPTVDSKTLEKSVMLRNASYKELRKRMDREKELTVIQQKLEIKRHLQNKNETAPKRIQPGTKHAPPIYHWEFERKK